MSDGRVPESVIARTPLTWVEPTLSLGAARDLDGGIELLNRVRTESGPTTIRLYRPQPTLAFGQRDTRLPGFEAAQAAAREHGFEPVVRKAGGRAAAYHQGTLIVDHVQREPDAMMKHKGRFIEFGQFFVDAFAQLGVETRVGEIPGEYCPGEYSVHGFSADGTPIKLVGTAQRVVQGAWFFSSVMVLQDSAPIRAVLDDVYQAMEIPMDPATVGAAEDSGIPGVSVESFTAVLKRLYEERYGA